MIGILRGEGEGDPERENEPRLRRARRGARDRGLRAAQPRDADLDARRARRDRRDPRDRAAAPDRRARAGARCARFLARGGALIALLEPGVDSGLEELLAEWGIDVARRGRDRSRRPARASAPSRTGVCPLAYNYETHAVDARPRPQPHDLLLRRAPVRAAQAAGRRRALRAGALEPAGLAQRRSRGALHDAGAEPPRRRRRLPADRGVRALPARRRRDAHLRGRRQRLRLQPLPARALQPRSRHERRALGAGARAADRAAPEDPRHRAVPAAGAGLAADALRRRPAAARAAADRRRRCGSRRARPQARDAAA